MKKMSGFVITLKNHGDKIIIGNAFIKYKSNNGRSIRIFVAAPEDVKISREHVKGKAK